MNSNIDFIEEEIKWITKVIDTRMKLYFQNECEYTSISEVLPSKKSYTDSSYYNFIYEHKLCYEERLALVLTLLPKLKPSLLDVFFTKNATYDKPFTEFGGVKAKNFHGIIPTAETLFFILIGDDIKARITLEHFFLNKSMLLKQRVLKLESVESIEPLSNGALYMNAEYVNYFIYGEFTKPSYSPSFPAKLIKTDLNWDDLILEPHVREEIEEIRTWIKWKSESSKENEIEKLVKPGFRCLFYGPPGTGKTLTASLLGKISNKDVYKIDLSMIVSKYIGETEKNLEIVFDMAENKNWILFFDEADALFGKRTATSSSNDKYANQETAYLLQRIEDYPGLILLATNLKMNIDDAFARRFQSMIYFPVPDVEQRLSLWENSFIKSGLKLSNVDLKLISQKYAITGGAINNVILSCILFVQKHKRQVTTEIILNGIKRELRKEGKTL
jgi:hypothetical protein